MKTFEEQYLALLDTCLQNGYHKSCRGGGKQRSLFGKQITVDLQHEFPLLTTRHISFKILATECLWILGGHTNIDYLNEHGVHIWDDFADSEGEVGTMYQWRNWSGDNTTIDQLALVVDEIKTNPESKRLIVSSWNVGELDQMSLPPCPHLFQFMVEGNQLHIQLTQRAGDLILGVPYDVGVYALLTHLVAKVTNLEVGTMFYNLADVHVYEEHVGLAKEILKQTRREPPSLEVLPRAQLDDFKITDFTLTGYSADFKTTAKPHVGPLFQTYFGSNNT